MSINVLPTTELLEKLFDNLHMPVAYLDRQFNFIKVNQAYAHADNKTPEFFVGLNHFELFPNEENKRIFSHVVKTGEVHYSRAKAFEYEYNPERGVTHWDWTLTPVFNCEQKVEGVLLMLLNVTEHINARIAIQHERQFSERILDTAGELIVVLNSKGEIYRFNKTCELLSGYYFSEIKAKHVWDLLVAGEKKADEIEKFHELIDNLNPSQYENEWITKTGQRKTILWNNTILKQSQGLENFVVCIGSDITERKIAESKLKKLSQIVEQINDAVIYTDLNGNILSWNNGAERIFGYSENEMLNKNLAGVYSDSQQEVLEKKIVNPLVNKGFFNAEVKLRRKSGEMFYADMSMYLFHDEDGQAIGMICYSKDVSKRKRAETELNLYRKRLEYIVQERTQAYLNAKEEADYANQKKSMFLRRMSHELRTPLNAILGFGQLLQLEELPTRIREFLDEVMQASNQLHLLINDLLDISRIEADVLQLNYTRVTTQQLVSESISMVQIQARDLGIKLVTEVHDANGINLYTDALRMKEILVNLLTNAIKYNKPGGQVNINVDIANNILRICISDTGIGIKNEFQQKLFEPYNRLGAENTEIEGTGMGLFIAKKLIEALGGSIGFKSEFGIGSSFWIEYPVNAVENIN